MEDLGTLLRNAREAQGISLKDIAARTKISVTALEALERNDFTRLPGGIFGRAFARAYALEVGLDADETVASFMAKLEQSEREAAERGTARPEVTDDDRQFLERQRRAIRLLRVALVVIGIAAVVGAIWLIQQRQPKTGSAAPQPPVVGPLPDVSSPPAPTSTAPEPLPTPSSEVGGQSDGAPSPDGIANTPSSLSSAALPAAQSAAGGALVSSVGTAVVAPALTAPVASTAVPSAAVVAELEFVADCWVSVMVDGRLVPGELVKAGDRRRYAGDREVSLDVGNAGAVRWTLNGKPAKPLGAPGTHTRTVVRHDALGQFVP